MNPTAAGISVTSEHPPSDTGALHRDIGDTAVTPVNRPMFVFFSRHSKRRRGAGNLCLPSETIFLSVRAVRDGDEAGFYGYALLQVCGSERLQRGDCAFWHDFVVRCHPR